MGFRITELPPQTGYLRPHDEALREVLRIVKANPFGLDLSAVEEGPFSRAMLFVGLCFRLDQPSTKYYLSGWVDFANDFLDRQGMAADIAANSLIAAVIAASDVPYRLPDARYGQVAEIGLDRFVGKANTNGWRLLSTRPLRAPLPPRIVANAFGPPQPGARVFDASGADIADDGGHGLWRR